METPKGNQDGTSSAKSMADGKQETTDDTTMTTALQETLDDTQEEVKEKEDTVGIAVSVERESIVGEVSKAALDTSQQHTKGKVL